MTPHGGIGEIVESSHYNDPNSNFLEWSAENLGRKSMCM